MHEPIQIPGPEIDIDRRRLFGFALPAAASGVAAVSAVTYGAASAQAPAAATARRHNSTDELTYLSATRLAQLIRDKEVSCVEAVEAYIRRQIEVNDLLNAVVMNSFARARAEARALDARAAMGDFAGPLHGVPMTLKDSIDTAGVITTGGTFGRQQYVPEKDATVTARLRDAGAVLLGKTNTPEFTLGGLAGISTSSNLLYGASHNPYDLTRSTAGSSGGSGAAVAAGLAAFDIGSDWGGSIRNPCHNNGIAGIKPTSVRVPRTGHIVDYGGVFDLWQQLGPMCRTVEDVALITPIISGPDYRDAACAPVPWRDPASVDLASLRVAFCDDNGSTGPRRTCEDTRRTVRQAASWMEEVATAVVEDVPAGAFMDLTEARSDLVRSDGWQFYMRLVEKWGTKNYSPRRREQQENVQPLTTAELVQAWERHDLARSHALRWLVNSHDVFICPVAESYAQPIDQESGGGSAGGWSYRGVFNSTGWPGVVVRCGSSADGKLPIGLQVLAAPWREDIAIAVAAYLESRSGGWQPPPV